MATRWYWSKDEVPDISPAFHADWDVTASAIRRVLRRTKLTGDTVTSSSVGGNAADQYNLHYQLITEPLNAGQSIGGSGIDGELVTFCLESGGNDDSVLAAVIRVFSRDGTTLRTEGSTIVTGGSAEFPFSGFPAQSRYDIWTTGAVAYETQAGDRLVVEVGHYSEPSAIEPITTNLRRGADDTGSDAAAANGGTSLTELPWFQHEFDLEEFVGPTFDGGMGVPQAIELQGLVLPVRMRDGGRYREYGIIRPYANKHRPHVIGRKRIPDE